MLAGRSSIARVQRIPVVALHRAGTRIDDLLPFATKRHGKRDGRAAVGRRYKAGTARIEDHGRQPRHALEWFGCGLIDLLALDVRPALAHAIA